MLAGLPLVLIFLDDIIVASKSMEQHQKDVYEVFRRLRTAGLVSSMRRSASLQFQKSSSLAIMSLLRILGHFLNHIRHFTFTV
jgi:hypothetical protein